MRVRLAAIALTLFGGLGCGGRAVAPLVASPAERITVERPEDRKAVSAADRPAAATQAAPAVAGNVPAARATPRVTAPAAATAHPKAKAAAPAAVVYHTLRRGQTLYSLARLYGVALADLIAANGVDNPRSIRAGTRILIPGAHAAVPARPAAPVYGPPPPDPGGQAGDRESETAEATRDDAPHDRQGARAETGTSLEWPLRGRVTGPYGPRGKKGRHTGIDIDGRKGDAILAAAPGVVVSAGMDGQYGRCVAIDHGDGTVTLYAHADRLLVNTGDQVSAGQRIADVGRSGNARGTHLHFEVRRDGRTVDPMAYLGED